MTDDIATAIAFHADAAREHLRLRDAAIRSAVNAGMSQRRAALLSGMTPKAIRRILAREPGAGRW